MRGRSSLGVLAGAVVLGGAACATPAAPATRVASTPDSVATVVTFGDSVPAGAACDCTPFPDLYARLLIPAAESVNLAHNGYTAVDVRRQVEEPAAQDAIRRAGTVLIMAGANDLSAVFDADRDSRDPADTAALAAAYAPAASQVEQAVDGTVARIRAIHPGDVRVLVFGYWNIVEDGDVARNDYGDDGIVEAATATRYANDALRTAAEHSDARYVPTVDAFKGADGNADPTDLLTDDGDHPNARGHEALARAAYDALPPS